MTLIPPKSPLFIVFDGMDGTGKTTQIKNLAAHLRDAGVPVFLTAEPSDSEDGHRLRRALSGKEPAGNSRLAALFLLDRIGHNEEITAHLAAGETVLCDRYYYASMAYQGIGDAFEWVAHMNLESPGIRKPDGCLLFDMDPAASMARITDGRRVDELEIYETTAQQEAIRTRFHRIRDRLRDRDLIFTVDAAGSIDTVANRVLEAYECIRAATEA